MTKPARAWRCPPCEDESTGEAFSSGSVRSATLISVCARALLRHGKIHPADVFGTNTGDRSDQAISVEAFWLEGEALAFTFSLPMPFGIRRMTVGTGRDAYINLPGLSLSPMMTDATVGRPIGRLTGHPAFDGLDHLRVTMVRQCTSPAGATATVLRFDDLVEPVDGTTPMDELAAFH